MSRGGRFLAAASQVSRIALAALIALAPLGAFPQTSSAGAHKSLLRIEAGKAPAHRHVVIGLNKSLMIEFPVELGDVIVSNPAQVDAVMQSADRAYLIGKALGAANAFFFDKNGNSVLTLEVRVERDLSQIAAMIDRIIPGADVRVEAVNESVVLTGTVPNAVDANRAGEIAASFAEKPEDVINMIAAQSKEQVLLKVQVIEMNRETAKRLGINWNANINVGQTIIGLATNSVFPLNSPLAFSPDLPLNFGGSGANIFSSGSSGDVLATIRALEQDGLLRTLAEPNLVAISGEPANFLAGGEFPVVTGVDDDTNTASIEFKKFGVGLAFTPVVLDGGRISLKIATEVSELSNEGAIISAGITIPGLKVRQAESTVELPSGGSLVMAGLISEESKQAINGIPGLKSIPILGALFRSRDFIKSETELVVIVTPFIVDPVARSKLARPDENFLLPSDAEAYALGRFNKITAPAAPPCCEGSLKDGYGFIIE